MDSTDDPQSDFYKEPLEVARDMLLNSVTRVGGAPGIGSPNGAAYARGRGWLSKNGCLTKKGVAEARRIQNEEGWT